MIKREELTTEEEEKYLGNSDRWSKWTTLSETVKVELNKPGLYEHALIVKKCTEDGTAIIRIPMYLGMSNTTIRERLSYYIKDGSHLNRFFKQFKEHGFVIETRWQEFSSISTRNTESEERPKLEESKILAKVNYILNHQENVKRRIDDLNKLIGDEKIVIIDKIEKTKKIKKDNEKTEEVGEILNVSEETTCKKLVKRKENKKKEIPNGTEKMYINSKNQKKSVFVDEENFVLKKDGTRDKRYTNPIKPL